MTPAERNRRKRRLEAAGFKALPTGWAPAAYVDRVAAQIEHYRAEVAKAEATELSRGRPPKKVLPDR
jgi:hypothetical protein